MTMTDHSTTDPRLQPGANANAPDYAKEEAARLEREYAGLKNTLQELAAEREKQTEIEDDDKEAAVHIGGIIKRFRDLYARIENTRVIEVEPNLRRMNADNAFFNGLKKIIQPEDKKERRSMPGHIDHLQGLIDDWQDRLEAKERARLEAIRIEDERLAKIARDKLIAEQAEAARLAAEAVLRQQEADRARTPVQIEKKAEVAEEAAKAAAQAEGAVHGAALTVEQTESNAERSYIDTRAKPADLVRTRGMTAQGGGVTLTRAKEKYADMVDRKKITDEGKVKLFAYFSDAEIEKAGRGYAKATQYAEKLDGFLIGERTKGVTR